MMKHMKSHLRILTPLMLLSGFAAPALAQVVYQSSTYQYPATRPVQWFVDGGASITEGQTAADFDNGWTIGTGLIFRQDPTQPFYLRLDVNYSRSEATNSFINQNQAATGVPIDDGSLQTVTGYLDGVLEAPISPAVRLYGTAGGGFGYRRIELTQNGFVCDPFFCGGYGHALVASSDTTHFAWNAGAGVNFMLPYGQSWFIEARYERIETQTPTEFIPIRVGFRF
jgi:opacity protein-like surface antigen